MYEECHQENRQLSYDIHGVKLQLEKVKHQLELAAQVSPYNTNKTVLTCVKLVLINVNKVLKSQNQKNGDGSEVECN